MAESSGMPKFGCELEVNSRALTAQLKARTPAAARRLEESDSTHTKSENTHKNVPHPTASDALTAHACAHTGNVTDLLSSQDSGPTNGGVCAYTPEPKALAGLPSRRKGESEGKDQE